jgi:hypothetical protein
MCYSIPHLREIIHYNLEQDYNKSFDLIPRPKLHPANTSRFTLVVKPKLII